MGLARNLKSVPAEMIVERKIAELQAQLAELRLQVKSARRKFVLVFERYRVLLRGSMRMAET